jgi:hypothetical protein
MATNENSLGVIDTPLDSDDTVALKTQGGNLFKIGNPVDNGDGAVTLEVRNRDELGGRGIEPPNIQITQIKGRGGSPPFRPFINPPYCSCLNSCISLFQY